MPKLVILRHGNTFDPGDVVLRVGAHTDLPLSSSGCKQAAAVGALLKREYGGFERILSSPLRRTMQTAEIVCDVMGADHRAAIEIADELKEIDYGPDEGRPETEVVARIGQAALAAWDTYAISPDGWHVDQDALTQSWRQLFKRIAGQTGPVLAATSNGIARFALAAAKSPITKSGGAPQKLRTGAYGVAEINAKGEAIIGEWDTRPST